MTDDRARGWIDLEELRRRIAAFAEAEAKASGLGGARVDVRIEASDGRGPRRIVVEVAEASGARTASDRDVDIGPEDN